ncbi:MAG TPA: zinc ABC transporter substrate-binding protein [Thermomicrobiales bacterium]|jgi:ABC-type Zn uptake system ZnuABC Zn-binding protein ZnuA|nr:zinc ABC transporter substrate-binding protein [Thermomicrobiales bacterium]
MTFTNHAALGGAWRLVGVFAVMVALVAGLGRPTAAQTEPLRVVATNSIIGDMIGNVGGEDVEITLLVPMGGDSHTFEPTPADADALASADLVFENGLGLEPWLDDVYEASGSTATRVVVTSAVTPLPADGESHEEGGAHEDEHAGEGTPGATDEHDHGEFDPHVWFDVANAQLMVVAIRDALVSASPERASVFEANATAYDGELAALDAYVVERTQSLPVESRRLVTSHDTFRYFADRYGFEIIGTALGSVTTESADPAAADIAALIDAIEASGVAAIFPENVSDPGLLEQIASETGVEIGPPLYTDALGDPDSEAGTYIDLVTYDVDAIVTALAG